MALPTKALEHEDTRKVDEHEEELANREILDSFALNKGRNGGTNQAYMNAQEWRNYWKTTRKPLLKSVRDASSRGKGKIDSRRIHGRL